MQHTKRKNGNFKKLAGCRKELNGAGRITQRIIVNYTL